MWQVTTQKRHIFFKLLCQMKYSMKQMLGLTFNLNEHIDVGHWVVVDGSFAEVVSLVAVLSVVDDQSVSTLAGVGAESTIVLGNYNRA